MLLDVESASTRELQEALAHANGTMSRFAYDGRPEWQTVYRGTFSPVEDELVARSRAESANRPLDECRTEVRYER